MYVSYCYFDKANYFMWWRRLCDQRWLYKRPRGICDLWSLIFFFSCPCSWPDYWGCAPNFGPLCHQGCKGFTMRIWTLRLCCRWFFFGPSQWKNTNELSGLVYAIDRSAIVYAYCRCADRGSSDSHTSLPFRLSSRVHFGSHPPIPEDKKGEIECRCATIPTSPTTFTTSV